MAAGPTLTLLGVGNVLSAAFGYSPASRLELLLNIERNHVPFQLYGSNTRGGTLTFVSDELRLVLLPASRVSPFAIAGGGSGVSRPNVNAAFPDRVRNDLRVLYLGGGVRVPLGRGFSLLGDARCMLGLEGYDGGLARPRGPGVALLNLGTSRCFVRVFLHAIHARIPRCRATTRDHPTPHT